ncbi:MAG: hypothetical protein ACI8ZN_001176 [Bacteroidia bacterium]|jgi:hypothetical protein
MLCGSSLAQIKDDSINYRKRKTVVLAGSGISYVSTMAGLYQLWYKDYGLKSFHFHNDNADWNQIDKVGHAYSCYYEGVVGIDMLKWAGYNKKFASILGGSYGFIVQSSVEVFDGYSEGWGASIGDIVANAVGTSLVISQSLKWDEQRIWLKVSYSATNFPSIRPELLGTNFIEQLFKDYNGHTYWLSANIKSFLPKESKMPPWLNLAFGYGIDGFVGASDNLFIQNNVAFDYSHLPRSRQFYLSPDIDLTRLPVHRKSLKIALRILNCVKFPMPAISFQSNSNNLTFKFVQF